MNIFAAFFSLLYAVNAQKLSDQYKQLGFKPHIFHYLNITPVATSIVEDKLDCSFACVQNGLCLSFNLAVSPNEKGKLWCELLPSSLYNNTAKLYSYGQFHHYSIQNPCANTPCMNDGACLPMLREGTYKCTCHPGYFGDHCEIDAPECRVYDVLNETDRHQSYGRGRNSDHSLVPGWYRFQSSSYTRMIDSCISHHKCSTDQTGWLKGGHPTFEDGIVVREACFNGFYKCCYKKVQIRVRECQGFYVYDLKPTPSGRRYCTKA